MRAIKLRLLGALGAALVPALAPGLAQASPIGTACQSALVRSVHVYDYTGFMGPNAWLYGNVGQCCYVGFG